MADTVYEKDGVSFTRYWGGTGDEVQITLHGSERRELGYVCMTVEELHEAVKAIDKSVEETKNAWWHTIAKR